MSEDADAIVIGSGPNGLAAAIALAQKGLSVRVIEGHTEIGGGTHTAELTLPGFAHDVCSACHPMGVLSPFFSSLPLGDHGLRWVRPAVSAAHPLDDGPAMLLRRSIEDTAATLREDARAYDDLVRPLLDHPRDLIADVLAAPFRMPRRPFAMARFGLHAIRSATAFAQARFRAERARAMFAGCAAHSVLPLDRPLTAAVGLIFSLTAHIDDWAVAEGGSFAITRALASLFQSLGGRIETGRWVRSLDELPASRVVLFDTSPAELVKIAGHALPRGYVERLQRYRYGPGVFKIDWALDGPIPWKDPSILEASTVHVGGSLDEIGYAEGAVWRGEHPERPFVLLCQQSQIDPTRAPAGKHTGYAYCHVPAGSTVDMTARIEAQVERFAPGFRDRVLARHTMTTRDYAAYNPSLVGGAITGGVMDATQLFTRPVARLDPYATPNPRLYLCSSSTPPGGGVHGMCGLHAAQSALRAIERGA